MAQVIIYASGLVVKEWANGDTWSEYPTVYSFRSPRHPQRIGYDKPEVFSKRERSFIRNHLQPSVN